jgi:hypothetical protein
VFTYLLGPFLAMLPRPWRNALPFSRAIQWSRAAALSGLLECALSLVAMFYWYSYTVMVWVDHAAGQVAGQVVGPVTQAPAIRTEADLHALGFAAYAIMLAHPLTWLIAYLFVEGAVRFSAAAFSGGIFGLLPLTIVDGIFRKLIGASPQGEDSLRPPELKPTFASVGSAVRDRVLASSAPSGADELRYRKSGQEEILEIHASRKKDGWDPPKVVRIEDKYYRLEELKRGLPPRPFVYFLRRLSAGVPGRNVLLYSPQNAVLTGQR